MPIPDADIVSLKQRIIPRHLKKVFHLIYGDDEYGGYPDAKNEYYWVPEVGHYSLTTGGFFPADRPTEKDPEKGCDLINLWQAMRSRTFPETIADLSKLCDKWDQGETDWEAYWESYYAERKELIAEAMFPGKRDYTQPPRSESGLGSHLYQKLIDIYGDEFTQLSEFKTVKSFTALLRRWKFEKEPFTVEEKVWAGNQDLKKGVKSIFTLTENNTVDRLRAMAPKPDIDMLEVAKQKQREDEEQQVVYEQKTEPDEERWALAEKRAEELQREDEAYQARCNEEMAKRTAPNPEIDALEAEAKRKQREDWWSK